MTSKKNISERFHTFCPNFQFCPDFHQIKTLGVQLHSLQPRLLHQW